MWAILLFFIAGMVSAIYLLSDMCRGELVDAVLFVLVVAAAFLAYDIAERETRDEGH